MSAAIPAAPLFGRKFETQRLVDLIDRVPERGGAVVVRGEATGGALSVMEFDDVEGHATPLHVHDGEDEVWIVLDGEITFVVGDDRFDLQAGDVAHGPQGVPHSYLIRSPRARMAVTFAPAGIEDWFAANGSPISGVDQAPAAFDIGAIVAAAEAFHPARRRTTAHSPAAALNPTTGSPPGKPRR